MGYLALALVVAAAVALGLGWTARPLAAERGPAYRLALATIAGLLGVGLLLLVLDLLRIAWHPLWLLPPAALGLLLRRLPGRRRASAGAPRHPVTAGDLAALGALGVFVVCTVALWDVHPDFVYHWGLKAKKFHLAAGLDEAFLGRPWNAAHLHPDYPNLLPALAALVAITAGGDALPLVPVLLLSAVFFALLLAAGREALAAGGASRAGLSAGMAVLGLVLAMFGVGYLQAGGADLMIALALLAAAAPLIGPPGPGADREVGILAGFAAASKIEGMPLAAFLVAIHLLRRARQLRPTPLGAGGRELLGAALRSSWPAALAVVLWAVPVACHDLFSAANTGGFEAGRAGAILAALWRALLLPNWHGLSFCLLLLPALALVRRLRPAVLLCSLQLAFYLYVYFSAPTDPVHYVDTTAGRLFFHLVPAVLMLGVIALEARRPAAERPSAGSMTTGPGRDPAPVNDEPDDDDFDGGLSEARREAASGEILSHDEVKRELGLL